MDHVYIPNERKPHYWLSVNGHGFIATADLAWNYAAARIEEGQVVSVVPFSWFWERGI